MILKENRDPGNIDIRQLHVATQQRLYALSSISLIILNRKIEAMKPKGSMSRQTYI
jgi:hypothetical protein